MGQPRLLHQEPEGSAADLSLADRLVPVDAGAAGLLGIVGVDHHEPVEADRGIEGIEGVLKGGGRGQRIAGRKHMAGVEADADPLLQRAAAVDDREHRRNLFEGVAQTAALAGGGFD